MARLSLQKGGTSTATGTGVVDGKLTLGTQDKIELGVRGHHLTSEVVGNSVRFMIPGQTVDSTGTGPMVECRQEASETRVITHGNSADAWTAVKTVAIGDRVRPTDAKATGFVYIATVGGTTGATEPATWPSGVGSTVVDNTVTWTRNVVLDKSGATKNGAYPESVDKYDQEWVSSDTNTAYTYNVIPQHNYILQRLYYKLGPSLVWDDATCRVRIRIYRGTSEAGTKIYDQSMGTLEATATGQTISANSEIWINIDNIVYSEGEELHFIAELVSTDPTCKLAVVTNAGNAQPWRAIDRQKFTHVALVPADTAYPNLRISSPTDGETGVSLTPTVVTELGQSRRTSWHGAPNQTITSPDTYLTIAMPANVLGTKGKLTGTFYFNQTVAANSSALVYAGLGSTSGQVTLPSTTGRRQVDFEILALTANSQRIVARAAGGNASVEAATSDLTGDNEFELFVSPGADGTIIFDGYDIQIFNSDVDILGGYNPTSTRIKIKDLAKNSYVSNGESTGLSASAATALTGSTKYKSYAQHKTSSGIWLPWVEGPSFTTLFNLTVNVSTSHEVAGVTSSLVAGDLIRVSVGETVNSTGYNFHVSGQSVEFPPTAYDSGEFRFKDSTGADLLFRINSVSGTSPNRTAVCDIETNAQVLSNGIIKLVGAGTPASNVSQFESAWADQLWDPASETYVQLWLRPDGIASSASLATWTNNKGVASNVTQGTSSKRPVASATLNGYNIPHFDGTDDIMTGTLAAATYGGNTSKTLIEFSRATASPADATHFFYGAAASLKAFGLKRTGASNVGFYQWGADMTDAVYSSTTLNRWIINVAKKDTNVLTLYENSVQRGTGSPVAVSLDNSNFTVGGRESNSFNTYAPVDIAEVILCSKALTDAERNKFEGWLAFKYGQLALLPAGHAYKTTPFRKLYTDKFLSVS